MRSLTAFMRRGLPGTGYRGEVSPWRLLVGVLAKSLRALLRLRLVLELRTVALRVVRTRFLADWIIGIRRTITDKAASCKEVLLDKHELLW